MEDILSHDAMIRLAALVDNVHWIYHVAEQLMLAEEHAIEHDLHFYWELDNIDRMFVWEDSPQVFNFWSNVSAIEQARPMIEGELPWFIDGKLVWHDMNWRV